MEKRPTFDQGRNGIIPKEWGELNYQPSPIMGERFDPDYFVPDNSASDTRDVVYSLGWKYAANLDNEEEIACMYASTISAFALELEDEFLRSMKGNKIRPHRIHIPSQAKASRIALNEQEKYGPDKKLVLFGTGLHILFKNIHMVKEVNYNRFVTNSINVLGGKLGMPHEVLARLKFPLTHKQACAVVGVFYCFEGLKAKIIRYISDVSM